MSAPARAIVHLVDDDASFRTSMSRLLRASGYLIKTYPSASEFLSQLNADTDGCVLADLSMPGMSGLDLQDALAKSAHPIPVVFITGQGDIPSSVRAMRQGAEDFLVKRAPKELLLAAVQRALERGAHERDRRERLRELRALLDTL